MSYDGPYPGEDIVGFVKRHLPAAIEYAEREHLITRRSRRYHLDRAVERGICAVGHIIPVLIAGRVTSVDFALAARPADPSCGYCQSAVEHARMWVPPDPDGLVPIDCAVCMERVELVDGDRRIWRHAHADRERACWTGDGSVATPNFGPVAPASAPTSP